MRTMGFSGSSAVLSLLLLVVLALLFTSSESKSFPYNYQAAATKIFAQSQKNIDFEDFTSLCDTFGPRFRGTQNLENALKWILARMKQQGLNATMEPVSNITNWIRGEESLTMLAPRVQKMALLGLGTSIGGSVQAEVFVANSFDDLTAHADQIPGKIVLYNVPFTSYGQTVAYRSRGASMAAKYGAVAALVRSIASFSLYTPHTGVQSYVAGIPKIPVAAITVEDAEMIGRMFNRSQRVVVNLTMSAQNPPDTSSWNILGQLDGCEKPEEVVVLGGHSDSWDVGQGAIDDGGGLFSSWEAVKLLNDLVSAGVLPCPRRSIRAVLWVDEEISQAGARAYLRDHMWELPNTIIAMESDMGNFDPTGFGFSGLPQAKAIMEQIGSVLLAPFGAGNITNGGADADNGPMYVPCASFDSNGFGQQPGFFSNYYFFFHHSNADSITHINRAGMKKSVAAWAILSYVLADMEQRLPSGYTPLPPTQGPLEAN